MDDLIREKHPTEFTIPSTQRQVHAHRALFAVGKSRGMNATLALDRRVTPQAEV